MEIVEVRTKEEMAPLARRLGEGSLSHERQVLSLWTMSIFRQIRCWVGLVDGEPVTFNSTHIGKRKTGVWEPYANCYVLFTRADVRRRGHCLQLANYVKDLAIASGCVRIRSLAGSHDGYYIHRAFGDWFWALTPNNELMIDTPWVGEFPTDKTPKAARLYTERLTPMTQEELDAVLRGKLRHDR